MDEYVERNLMLSHPWIYNNMVECKENGKWEYIITTSDGNVYAYDWFDDTCRRVTAKPEMMNESEFKKEFGRRLAKMMRRKRMTQKDLSAATGIPQSMISSYITGRNVPSFYKVNRIATALECSIDEFRRIV